MSSENQRKLLQIANKEPVLTDNYWSSEPNQPVRVRYLNQEKDQDVSNMESITVHTAFVRCVEKRGKLFAMAYKKDPKKSEYTKITYEEYYFLVCDIAKAFIHLGLEEFNSVCILGFNSVPWFVSNMAAIFAGGLACGIYTTNNAEACEHILNDSRCNILLIENKSYMEKITPIYSKLKYLKKIIVWNDEVNEQENFMSWQQLLDLGKKQDDQMLIERLNKQVPNHCCTLIYTSGTTGNPKGVMISHDNLTWTARWTQSYVKFNYDTERTVSYLPLSHVAAQLVDLHLPIVTGGLVHFAEPDALRGSLKQTLNEVRPTRFLGVPRVYEKMQEKMREMGEKMSFIKRAIGTWSKQKGYEGSLAVINGTSHPWFWSLANALAFSKAKQALGFNETSMLVSAAAPMTKATLDYFMSLDMIINEVYGMSECTGPQTFSIPGQIRITSVGKCPNGSKLTLLDKDSEGQGEVAMFGRNVFMGYLRAPEKTKETFTSDCWLRSGDLGRFDEGGFLHITGRLKELIITAGGENVAPIPIEDRIREVLPCISQAMVIGDKLKFLSVLLTLKTHINEETQEPRDELTSIAQKWCHQHGCEIKTVKEFCSGKFPQLNEAIDKAIKEVNEKSISNASRIQKFLILPRDFSIPGGELGPTMKARRPIIMKMYEKEISALYN